MAKLYKIQTYILDYNDDLHNAEILKAYLDARILYGLLEHTHITEVNIGEWDDEHPLNIVDCPEAEYEKYFKENTK